MLNKPDDIKHHLDLVELSDILKWRRTDSRVSKELMECTISFSISTIQVTHQPAGSQTKFKLSLPFSSVMGMTFSDNMLTADLVSKPSIKSKSPGPSPSTKSTWLPSDLLHECKSDAKYRLKVVFHASAQSAQLLSKLQVCRQFLFSVKHCHMDSKERIMASTPHQLAARNSSFQLHAILRLSERCSWQ